MQIYAERKFLHRNGSEENFKFIFTYFLFLQNRNQLELFERPFPRIRQKLVRSMHWSTKKAHQVDTSTDHVRITHCFILLMYLA